MKKLFCVILCVNLGLVLISCSSKEKTESSAPTVTDSSSNSQEQKQDSSKNTEESSTNSNETNTTADTKQTKPATSNLVSLSTFTVDNDTLSLKILGTIQVEENLPLKDKLTKLADELSARYFNGLPIRVVRVETINGAKRATISLDDIANDTTKSWARNYFQGTTGGSLTAKILIETFKQSSYPGEWINSVEFLYNNQKIEFEHIQNLENPINLR